MPIPAKPTLPFLKSVLKKGSDLFKDYSTEELQKLAVDYITRFAGGNKKQAAHQLGYGADNKNNMFTQKLARKDVDLKSLGGGNTIKFTKTQLDEALPKEIENYNKTELKNYIKKKFSPKSTERNVNDINAYKAIDKYIIEYAGGNENKAFKELSKYDSFLTRNNVSKSLARKRGYDFEASAGFVEPTIDAPVKYKTFSEATIAAREGKFNINERVKELINQGKIQKNKKYYNTKDIAIIFNMEPTRANTMDISKYFSKPYKLYKGGIKGGVQPKIKKGANPIYNEYELNSTVKNFDIHTKTRQAPPDSDTSTFKNRRKKIADIDENFTKYINNYKGTRAKTLSSFPELNKIINQDSEGVMFDIGHSVPVEILDRFDFMRSPENLKKFHSIKDFTIQDPRINRDILVGSDLYKKGASIAKRSGGFQAKEAQLINDLNLFLNKNKGKTVDENSLKFINEWNAKAKQLYQDKFNAVNEFVVKNVQKEPYLKGQQFTTTGFKFNAKPGQKINGDMLDIDKTFFKSDKTLGQIGSINPNANTWDELSVDEKVRINQNIANQTLDYITVAANKSNIPGQPKLFEPSDIEEFGEQLLFGDPNTRGKGLFGKSMNTVLGIGGGYKGVEIIGENLLGTEVQASERKPGETFDSEAADVNYMQTGFNLPNDTEFGDPDTWDMKVGQFIEESPFLSTFGAAGTALQASQLKKPTTFGKFAKQIAAFPVGAAIKGVGTVVTPLGLTGLTGATFDIEDPLSRGMVGLDLAFAKDSVDVAKSLGSKATSNPAIQSGVTRLLNLGLSPAAAMRAARFASPLGMLLLAGEGGYQFYQALEDEKARIAAMSPEERQAFEEEQTAAAYMGEAENFAYGGRVGMKIGGDPKDKRGIKGIESKLPIDPNMPQDPGRRNFLEKMGIGSLGIGALMTGAIKFGPETVKAVKKAAPDFSSTNVPAIVEELYSVIKNFGKQTDYPKPGSGDVKYEFGPYKMEEGPGGYNITKTNEGEYSYSEEYFGVYRDPETGAIEYEELTVRPDMDGKLKDVDYGVDAQTYRDIGSDLTDTTGNDVYKVIAEEDIKGVLDDGGVIMDQGVLKSGK